MATEKRLIDANDLIKELEFLAKHEDYWKRNTILGVVHTIEKRTTVDAVPVVHGRWEDMSDKFDKGMDLRCSVCHRRASNFVGGSEDWWDMWKPFFCPNCGAKMDGDNHV